MCSKDLSTSHHIETEIGGKSVIVQILRLCFITVLISIDEDISSHFENHFSRQNPSIRLVHCCYHKRSFQRSAGQDTQLSNELKHLWQINNVSRKVHGKIWIPDYLLGGLQQTSKE